MIKHIRSESTRQRLFRACGVACVSYPVVGVFRSSRIRVGSRGGLTIFPTQHEVPYAIASLNNGNVRASSWLCIIVVLTGIRRVVLIDQRSAESKNVRDV